LVENEKDPKKNKLVIGINVYDYKDLEIAKTFNNGRIVIIDVIFI
jgi:hypothetical protein